jgi:hypothetical protein
MEQDPYRELEKVLGELEVLRDKYVVPPAARISKAEEWAVHHEVKVSLAGILAEITVFEDGNLMHCDMATVKLSESEAE